MKLTLADQAFLLTVLGEIDVHSPSAARSAMVARISRKLSKMPIPDDGAFITFSDTEYRVLDNLLWETKKRTNNAQIAEAAEKLWGTLITSLPHYPDEIEG